MQEVIENTKLRLILSILGGLAGLSFYFLIEQTTDPINHPRLIFALGAVLTSFFSSLMLLTGPMMFAKAALASAGISFTSSLMVIWASFRFADIGKFLNSGAPVLAYFILIFLPLSFVLTIGGSGRKWHDYEALFDHAWSLVVRVVASGLFTGLFWGVMFLSSFLLQLAGSDLLRNLLQEAWFWMTLNGVVIGLALAVLHEMTGVVSTLRRLVLLLLRLLLPFVCLVTVFFLILLPLRGLGDLFVSRSAAAVLLAMSLGGITLISAAVEARDSDAAQTRLMVWSARILAALLPIMAGIALYAIWLRVAQYGLTPDRVSAVVFALIVLGYAGIYSYSVIFGGRRWRKRIRDGNVRVALGVIVLSAVWLSPVLNDMRLSANNQLNRFEAGKTSVENLPLWEMSHDWGYAGQRTFETLAQDSANSELASYVARVRTATSRWEARRGISEVGAEEIAADIVSLLPVVPDGAKLPDGIFQRSKNSQLEALLKACEAELPGGAPRCVAVVGDFLKDKPRDEAFIVWMRSAVAQKPNVLFYGQPEGYSARKLITVFRGFPEVSGKEQTADLIETLQSGAYSLEAAPIFSLKVGDHAVLPPIH